MMTHPGSALPLAEGQVLGQLSFAAAWQTVFALSGDSTIPSYLEYTLKMSTQDIFTTVLCIIWIGFAANALSTWAQIVGQQRVGASKAAIFYASQPVWAAGLSIASGLDSLSNNEIAGGAFIIAGSLLLAVVDHYSSQEKKT